MSLALGITALALYGLAVTVWAVAMWRLRQTGIPQWRTIRNGWTIWVVGVVCTIGANLA